MRHPRYSPQFHYILLGALIFEFVELEVFNLGVLHHLSDGLLIIVFAFSTAVLSASRKHGAAIFIIAAVPWLMDVTGIRPAGFELDSFLWFVVHSYVAWVILLSLREIADISHTEIIDSVSLYIVVGMAFANLYNVVLFHDPNAILTGNAAGKITYDLVVYFSFVTQATVGYGEIVPNNKLVRSLSVIQAIFGVMYVAVLIARFVTIYAANELHRSRSGEQQKEPPEREAP